jgi:glycosyltransferase involved in cell wall biosynthesis
MQSEISVIITSYNQMDYLKEAIDSVLAQTFRPHEILICDDASTDGSRDIIATYETRFPGLVRGIFQEKNIGIARNRSSGLEQVRSDLVCWLDGDDRYKPLKLERELEIYLKDPDIKWVYSQVDVIDENGRKLRVRYDDPPEGYILEDVVTMLGRAPRNMLIEYNSLKKIGFFRYDMSLYEDFDLCLRLSRNFKVAYCPESLVEYRIHGGGLHRLNKQEHLKNLKMLYENFKDLVADYPLKERSDLEERFRKVVNKMAGSDIIGGRKSLFDSCRRYFRKFV